MYAIVEIGGKQYKVEQGVTINVDKLKGEKNDNITFDKVLLFVDEDKVMVGQPYLENVKISADVLGVVRGNKVQGIKFKKRKNYTRTIGHRPQYLQLKINNFTVV